MTAIEDLTQAVQDQSSVITEAVTDITTPHVSDAQAKAAADGVRANTKRLTDALHPSPTP